MSVFGPSRAMVLAAGRGTRMRPLTDDRCKALVDVGGATLIDWTLDKLAAAGVETAVVNVHHFADRLEAHLAARRGGPDIVISDERAELMDTGGGLVKARALLGEDPIFTANIDALWIDGAKPELARLAEAFDPARMDVLMLLSPMDRHLGFSGPGDFNLDAQGRLVRRDDRPGADFAFAGVQILNPKLLDDRPSEPFSTNLIWNDAIAAGRAFGAPMEVFWMHVGDPAAREQAEDRLKGAA